MKKAKIAYKLKAERRITGLTRKETDRQRRGKEKSKFHWVKS